VSSGQVLLEQEGRESLVPAGASCETRAGGTLGTPVFDDAPAELKRALHDFDFAGGGREALDTVLRHARVRDSLTLWHLLKRADRSFRNAVFLRLSELAPPPQGCTSPEALDEAHLEQWKDSLLAHW
jgi:hypothetical protein